MAEKIAELEKEVKSNQAASDILRNMIDRGDAI